MRLGARLVSIGPLALATLLAAAGCRSAPALPAPPQAPGPPAISDAQPVVDAPLFIGQNAFASPLGQQADYAPPLASVRLDGGNSGVAEGPAPLGRAPVTGSAAVPLGPPLLWGPRGGLTTGCQIRVDPGLTKSCLAAVDTATLDVQARWLPPGQDLNLATAIVDNDQNVVVTTHQGHLFVVARPSGGSSTFRVQRDVDLGTHLGAGQVLLAATLDANGNLWFVTGGGSATDTTVGYVTSDDQVVTTILHNQVDATGLTVDQQDVYLATGPAGPAGATNPAGATGPAGPHGSVYDLQANDGQVELMWQEPFDAGTAVKPGSSTMGTGAPVLLLGSQYLAVTDNADPQTHLLVFLRGPLPESAVHGTTTTSPTSTSSTTLSGAHPPTTATTAIPTPAAGDPRLVCTVALFGAGASAVNSAPVAYSSGDTNSVIVANGYNAPPPLTGPTDEGVNNLAPMAPGLTRIDVRADGSGCQTQWSTALRLSSAPVLSTTSGLVYGYSQDPVRAGTGSYIWYFVAVDYGTGRVVWQLRAGAGSTKNANREPMVLGANGLLYQSVPLGLVWMRDVSQQP